MKHRWSILLAASSILLLGSLAFAAVRPHYGGTLRIAIKDAPQNLDPAILAEGNSGNIARLIFETLVQLDERAHPQPSLAILPLDTPLDPPRLRPHLE